MMKFFYHYRKRSRSDLCLRYIEAVVDVSILTAVLSRNIVA